VALAVANQAVKDGLNIDDIKDVEKAVSDMQWAPEYQPLNIEMAD
jgi:malate dehydrogenase (oxaloacetate-decarboxylating)